MFKPLHLSPSDRTAIAQKYGTVAPFLLFVGTLEPRKNLDFMLQLMPQLAANGLRLVVVGASGETSGISIPHDYLRWVCPYG